MKFSDLAVGAFFKVTKYSDDIDPNFTPHQPGNTIYRRCKNVPAPCGGYYNAISETLSVSFIPEDAKVACVRSCEALDHMTTVALSAQDLRDQFYARVKELEKMASPQPRSETRLGEIRFG